MRKKTLLIVLAVILVILAGFGFRLYLSLNGSLIRKFVMTKQVKQYVAQVYPDEDLEVDFAAYDFKMCGYFCNVHSPEGGDLYFSVYEDGDGNLSDDFVLRVLAKENTISRLSRSLDDFTKAFIAENFPHRTSLVMCDTATEITDSVRDSLRLNMPFDIAGFPLPCEMIVWVETAGDEPSREEMAERLRELYAATKETFPFVTHYSMSIQDRYVETDGECGPEDYSGEISVYEVPAEIIDTPKLEVWLDDEWKRQEAEEEEIRKETEQ